MFIRWRLTAGLLLAICAGGALATTSSVRPAQPEGTSGWTPKPGWQTQTFAIAAANPLAARAGQQILQAGGSAVDAAVAAQMVLTLVEPQSSGIGGGAFLLHFDGRTTQAFDGRETAPAKADGTLFLQNDGKPMPRDAAMVGGRAVGAPGVVAMLYAAHQQHGKLPWKALFEPAISLATHGFVVSPRMATLLANDRFLAQDPVARAYFYDRNGRPWPAGHRLKNPELAYVLRQIAARGPAGLMENAVGQAIVRKVQTHPRNPGLLDLADLQNYRAVVRAPLCFVYATPHNARGYRICGMPPPSSGALAIAQILKLLEQTAAKGMPLAAGMPSAPWLHAYAEASRLAFADRDQHIGDPAFVAPPAGNWESLLGQAYIQERAALIRTAPDAKSMGVAAPGNPAGTGQRYGAMPAQLEHGTSHVSVVDQFGNAVAMTTSIEDGFGSRQMVNLGAGRRGGFLLNNQLTDFSFSPQDAQGRPIANRVEPGKRPRSAMSPTLVFDAETGKLVMTVGSPGGAMIIHFVSKVLYGVLQWDLDIQSAINLPNFGSLNGPTLMENTGFSPAVQSYLQERQHSPLVLPLPSGLQGIQRNSNGYFGGADPRREGIVLGD